MVLVLTEVHQKVKLFQFFLSRFLLQYYALIAEGIQSGGQCMPQLAALKIGNTLFDLTQGSTFRFICSLLVD